MGIKKILVDFLSYRLLGRQKTEQLFFIGNKRSGTTILAEKINLHPDIYITHETDIIWILYNLYNGIEFEYYSKDEPHSTVVTRELCEPILKNFKRMTPLECFGQCQRHLMDTGTQWRKPTKKAPIILGDKKPNQQGEIRVNDWVRQYFPNTTYIHIVRHPFDFLHSIPRLLPKYDLGSRYGSSKCEDPLKILETWAYFENLVLEHKQKGKIRIHSLRFEDFCENPATELEKIWKFSGLQIPSDLKEKIERKDDFGIISGGLHGDSRGNHYKGPVPESTQRIMELYDYHAA